MSSVQCIYCQLQCSPYSVFTSNYIVYWRVYIVNYSVHWKMHVLPIKLFTVQCIYCQFIQCLLYIVVTIHSPLPLASWILHSLPAVAATHSRDEPTWLVACSVWNMNWQHTGPAPAFSVEREWVRDSVSDWLCEWVSQGACLSPSLILLPRFVPSISHRASLTAPAAVVNH